MKRILGLLLVALMCISLVACGGSKLDGKYKNELTGAVLEFDGNEIIVDGESVEYEYEDGKIIIEGVALYTYDEEKDIITDNLTGLVVYEKVD